LVTITHPHHPLRGRQVEIIRIRRGADPDIVVGLPDGSHAAIAMSWTDFGAAPQAKTTDVAPHLLDLEGLRHALRVIDRIRQDGRFPQSKTRAKQRASRRR
jgi:hypothetical protein